MLFYSIYPLEVILGTEEEEKPEQWRELEVDGKRVLVSMNSKGEQTISRLLSTDPEDFLNPRFTPGNVIF
ncbi:MAG TPA: hypothetical protein DDZ55_04625 [Firmicutes bacterium]|jgi:hypothetical protein|nr:hypothetical protein [Bacillota bacterium]HBR28647.1 hypothetical protein [Bacillota bacterium]